VTYNAALEALLKRTAQKKTEAWLKNRYTRACNVPRKRSFLLDAPTHVRDGAIFDLMKGLIANASKRKKNPIHTFKMRYRSKKDDQSIYLEKTEVKAILEGEGSKDFLKIYPTHVTNALFMISKRAKLLNPSGKVQFDARLVMNKLGHFHIHATVETDVSVPENQGDEIVALDPGVRTFLTGYSPTPGMAIQVAPGCIQRLIRLEYTANRIRSKMIRLPPRSRARARRMQRAELRVHERVRNLVSEVHWKTARSLTNDFGSIILPPFGTTRMCTRMCLGSAQQSDDSVADRGRIAYELRRPGCFFHVAVQVHHSSIRLRVASL
jgi:transposase